MFPVIMIILGCLSSIKSQNDSLSLKLNDLLESAKVPGIQIAYFENDQPIVSITAGFANIDQQKPVSQETIFAAASLSKVVFAAIVLHLVEQNYMELDVPLINYFRYPDLENSKSYPELTARMVLTHQTGLPNWRRNGQPLNFEYAPELKFRYSGEGFVLLQKTVENIMGKSLEELAEAYIFKPLEMKHSSYIWKEKYEVLYATPYTETMDTAKFFKMEEPNAAYSLQTTAEDYLKFLKGLLQGELISNEMVKSMFLPQITVDKLEEGQIYWGLGIGIQETKEGREVWHWGDNNTFKAYFTMSFDNNYAMVYFTNGKNGLSFTPDIVQLFINSPQPAWIWCDYDYFKKS